MVDGVNYAPFASFGGWSGAVNAYSTDKATASADVTARKKQQDAAYDFLSYMSAPAQSNEDVTLGKTGYNPYRTSQFSSTDLWVKAGLSKAAADNYLGAIKASLTNKNMILDMRIPQTVQYQQNILDVALAQYLAGELDATATENQIATGWDAITDKAGRDKQLAAYVASLGVQR
jgi:multiple sugar transport system substrate-binding protein